MPVFTALNNTKKSNKNNITPYGENFLSVNLLGYNYIKIWRVTFLKSFLTLKILGWSSGFRAIDDSPRAHRDETEFRIISTVTARLFYKLSHCHYFLNKGQ